MPFDFLIEKYKIIIELDGRQHFEQVSNWENPKNVQKNDMHKMKKAIHNGYTIIRLLQNDVYNNKNNWKKNLIDNIKYHKNPCCILL